MPNSTLNKFRGKDACTTRVYATITRAPFGSGKGISLGSAMTNKNLTRQDKLSFSVSAMRQAFDALEKRGFVEYIGQKNGDPAQVSRKYRVLVDFDETLVPDGTVRRSPSAGDLPVPTVRTKTVYPNTPAPTNVAPASSGSVKSLEQRVADLEARLTEVVGRLHSV